MSMEHVFYNNSSNEIRNIIIHLGTNVFYKLGFDKLRDEEILKTYSMTNDTANIEEMLHKSFENEKNIYKSRENNLKKQNESLQSSIIILEEQKNTLREEMDKRIKNEIDKSKEYYDSKLHEKDKYIESLSRDIKLQTIIEENFLEKKEFSHSTAQGDYVEKMFDEIVNNGLPYDDKAFIEDTSNIGGSGDRLIIFSNGFRLLIEVKNKGTIQKDDIVDFQRHYIKDFEENKIDKALFFSFRTPQIPSVCKAICPQYKENNKVIYYGLTENQTVDEKKARIYECIEEIYRKHLLEKENDKKEEDYHSSNVYEMYLEDLINNKLSVTNKLKINEKDKNELTKELTNINKKINELHLDIQMKNITVRGDLLDDSIYKACLISRIMKWKEDNKITFHKSKWREQIRKGIILTTYDDKILSKKIKQCDLQ